MTSLSSSLQANYKTQLMGVLNITPDSFSDGGAFVSLEQALAHAEQMIEEGAHILDIGAESTAPNARPIDAETEWKRLEAILPPLFKLCGERKIAISLDTQKASVAKQFLELASRSFAQKNQNPPYPPSKGGVMESLFINDVSAFGDPEMPSVIAEYGVPVVLVFSKEGSAYYEKPYHDILAEIRAFFEEKIMMAKRAGIPSKKVVLDPGMGAFLSSDPTKSFFVLKHLKKLKEWFPEQQLLVGTSRKSFLRAVSHPTDPKKRLMASVISALWAAEHGADILRVHDVAETREALDTFFAIQDA